MYTFWNKVLHFFFLQWILEAEDIDTMLERMEEQVKNLARSYRIELEQIEVGDFWNFLAIDTISHAVKAWLALNWKRGKFDSRSAARIPDTKLINCCKDT